MSHFDPRIINSNPKSISGTPILVGLGLVFLVILLWASVAYVPPGNVGVLVYFGRVTGETLPAGTHLSLHSKSTTFSPCGRRRRKSTPRRLPWKG